VNKRQIAIYGAGGFGREASWLAQSGVISGKALKSFALLMMTTRFVEKY